MTERLILHDRHWRAIVAPEQGGSLLSCDFDGAVVLQPVAAPRHHGATWPARCYFPLVPFSNRIENGEFAFDGARIRLPGNVPGSAHAMHGHGWLAAWTVRNSSTTECSLAYERTADDEWPWHYEATQTFAIAGNALRITLDIRNLDAQAMPCGLGFHPFFPAHPTTRLRLRAARVWNGAAGEFPRHCLPVPRPLCFDAGALLAERLGVDHCYEGWDRRALVTSEDRAGGIVVQGCEATDFLVVYVPRDAGYFCVEPVTHAVNAVNLRDPATAGLWSLAPAQRREIAMTIATRVAA